MPIKKSLFNGIWLYALSNWLRLNISYLLIIIYSEMSSPLYSNFRFELRGLAFMNLTFFLIYLITDWIVFSFVSVIFNITIAYIVSFVLFWTAALLFVRPFTSQDALEAIIPCLIGYVAVGFCYWRTVKRWGL